MRLLGIDYGLKKVGLAISEGLLAEPLLVLTNKLSVINKISNVCQEQRVEKIIVGLPEGEIAKQVEGFGQKVVKLTGLPVEYQDESLTSKEAIVKMIEAGKKRKDRRRFEDAIAAAIILQSYIDRQK